MNHKINKIRIELSYLLWKLDQPDYTDAFELINKLNHFYKLKGYHQAEIYLTKYKRRQPLNFQ